MSYQSSDAGAAAGWMTMGVVGAIALAILKVVFRYVKVVRR